MRSLTAPPAAFRFYAWESGGKVFVEELDFAGLNDDGEVVLLSGDRSGHFRPVTDSHQFLGFGSTREEAEAVGREELPGHLEREKERIAAARAARAKQEAALAAYEKRVKGLP